MGSPHARDPPHREESMANKMLIDAAHPEETRVVVLRGNRVEEFDFESAHRRQLRGNIYLAKVTRVEPSLQAAFVDYGGNRHGFLAFSEIHPDYYQIPVADRQALIEEEERAHRAAEAEVERRATRSRHQPRAAGLVADAVRSEPLAEPEPGSEEALLLDAQVDEAAAEEAVFAAESVAETSEFREPEGRADDRTAATEDAADEFAPASSEASPETVAPQPHVVANGDARLTEDQHADPVFDEPLPAPSAIA